ILRNPLNRTLSTLRHMQRDPQFHSLHWRVKDRSLSDILRDSVIMEEQRDVQTRILCSTIVPKALIDYVRASEARGETVDPRLIESPKATLELAQERLRQISYIGISEDLENTMRSLSRAMGYHPPRAMGFRNHAPDGLSEYTQLSAADIGILRAY